MIHLIKVFVVLLRSYLFMYIFEESEVRFLGLYCEQVAVGKIIVYVTFLTR